MNHKVIFDDALARFPFTLEPTGQRDGALTPAHPDGTTQFGIEYNCTIEPEDCTPFEGIGWLEYDAFPEGAERTISGFFIMRNMPANTILWADYDEDSRCWRFRVHQHPLKGVTKWKSMFAR